jgi:molybdopterin/thiamine biosynthesis adenylyltransferase
MTAQSIRSAIDAAACSGSFPDGRPGRFLDRAAVAALAERFALPPRQVEIAALGAGACPLRYARNLHALSLAEQARLLAATVAQVGLGGLGGGILECLARSGVGTIRAADGDVFEESNLNRQLLSDGATLGGPKAVAAAARVRAVNPAVDFTGQTAFLDAAGMTALLDGADLAVDALGGLKDRPALAAAAKARGIPLVTGAVAGYTAIVATVRPGDPSPLDIFGASGAGTAAEDVLGCPAPAVMAVAALQAAEAVRILAGRQPALAGKALIVDLETMRFDTVTI